MITRRDFLAAAGGAALAAGGLPAHATQAAVDEAVRALTGGAEVRKGRVKLDVPPLIDNGNAVAVVVSVDSPMTQDDHVRSIHLFAPGNPLPVMLGVFLGPRAGRARITTRLRVADSQTLTAVARLSDGTFWSDSVSVVVTIAACTEDR
jgi:sulfur-oxidizing protein SoxY